MSSATVVGVLTSYVYDSSGFRVKETTGSNSRTFLPDTVNPTSNTQALEEEVNGGQMDRAYLLGLRVEAQSDNQGTVYLLRDGHGSTRMLANPSGGIITDGGGNPLVASYDAYGANIGSNAVASRTTQGFGGDGEADSVVGMTYHDARWRQGYRFISADPMGYASNGDPTSMHLYSYTPANPVNGGDPSGHEFAMDVSAAMYMGRTTDLGGAAFAASYGRMWHLNVAEMDPYAAGVKEALLTVAKWMKDRPPGAAEGKESWIPLYGSVKNMIAYFEDGRFGWAAFYAAQSIADAFMVTSLVEGGLSLGGKLVGKLGEVSAETLVEDAMRGGEEAAAEAASVFGEAAGEQRAIADICDTGLSCFVAGTPVLQGDGEHESIEQVHVGQRVKTYGGAANSADSKTKSKWPNTTEVDPKTWRLVTINAGDWRLQTLEPLSWVAQHHLASGRALRLADIVDVAEMGVPERLTGIVESVGACPPIDRGPGRVVLTTVTHLNNYVFHLTLDGSAGREDTLGVTGYHRFYSESRGWEPVDQLKAGEVVRGVEGGDVTVSSVVRDPGTYRVYNMTVEADHVYYVGGLDVLTHNNCPKPWETELMDVDGLSEFRPNEIGGVDAELHHIATIYDGEANFASRFRAIFNEASFDLEDEVNKIMITGHFGPHDAMYHQIVLGALEKATAGLEGEALRNAFISAMEELRARVQNPSDVLNYLITH
jgi:RHS repeat-associated protein